MKKAWRFDLTPSEVLTVSSGGELSLLVPVSPHRGGSTWIEEVSAGQWCHAWDSVTFDDHFAMGAEQKYSRIRCPFPSVGLTVSLGEPWSSTRVGTFSEYGHRYDPGQIRRPSRKMLPDMVRLRAMVESIQVVQTYELSKPDLDRFDRERGRRLLKKDPLRERYVWDVKLKLIQ